MQLVTSRGQTSGW